MKNVQKPISRSIVYVILLHNDRMTKKKQNNFLFSFRVYLTFMIENVLLL